MIKKNTSTWVIRMLCVVISMGYISCQSQKSNIRFDHSDKELTSIRINNPATYLLLPVEESAPESKVYIQGDTDRMAMDVRLARGQVDYYVPFTLPAGSEEIIVEVKHAPDKPVLWDKIELSDTFDKSNREKFRPVYHHAPVYGWMNDPNGLVYLDGEYHLFYQYNPYGSMWGNMHWGHAVSKDLVTWEHLPVAIDPDELGTVFSGNCIIDTENTAGFGKNAMIAFYTSAGKEQTQSIAYSLDKGRTFQKYAKNPVVSADIPDFRDPNVFYHQPTQKWIMVIAAGQEVQLYSSKNLLDWQYESAFGEGYGNHGGVWECPDLLELPIEGEPGKTKWVLLLNINPGGIFGGSATQYFTGNFDGTTFTCESAPQAEKWMDWGKDHYATITWTDAPDNRHIAIAWMSNWQYANQVPTQQFRSANSVPRDIKLYKDNKEYYLINEPVEELKKLRKDEHIFSAKVTDQYNIESLLDNNEGTYELEIDFSDISADVFGFTLFNGKGDSVDMYYDRTENRFYMDRTKSGITDFSPDFAAVTYAPVKKANKYTLRIFVDKSSIECFAGDGRFVMTNLVFPNEPYNRVTFYTKGGNFNVENMKVYRLGL